MSTYQLHRQQAGLLVIDFQERLAAAMPPEDLGWALENARRLIEGAEILGLPIWVTEQYPKGIGPTLSTITEVLPDDNQPFEKVEFSCAAVSALAEAIEESGRKQLIACGMEAHICVFQSVRDYVAQGFEVHVPADAVVSRTAGNMDVGLHLIEKAGGVLTSTETLLFDLLQKAGTPEFKQISKLVK